MHTGDGELAFIGSFSENVPVFNSSVRRNRHFDERQDLIVPAGRRVPYERKEVQLLHVPQLDLVEGPEYPPALSYPFPYGSASRPFVPHA